MFAGVFLVVAGLELYGTALGTMDLADARARARAVPGQPAEWRGERLRRLRRRGARAREPDPLARPAEGATARSPLAPNRDPCAGRLSQRMQRPGSGLDPCMCPNSSTRSDSQACVHDVGHRTTVSQRLGAAPPWFLDTAGLLSFFAPTHEAARRRYREQVEGEAREPPAGHPLAVGDDAFVRSALSQLEPRAGVPRRYLRTPRPPLSSLLAVSAHGDGLLRARRHGYSLREIARELDVNASTVSRRLRRLRTPARAVREPAGDRTDPAA